MIKHVVFQNNIEIEAGGYDLNIVEDAEWLLSKESEFEELIEKASKLIEDIADIQNEIAEAEYKKSFPEEDN